MDRLTKLDEWPRHQTGGTFDSVASDSPHWNDGYYFTLGDPDSGLTLFSGIRLYPNTDVIDGYVCIGIDGQQHNLRWSRRLRPRIDDIAVGPFALDIIEPLEILMTTCAPNETGISYSLTWHGLHEPYFEEYIERYTRGRKVYQRNNYDQCCEVEGWIEVAGKRFELNSSWVGVRDHSWGIGRTGGATSPAIAPDAGPDPRRGFAMRQWTMMRMPDRIMFWQFHLMPDGSYNQLETVVIPFDSAQPIWSYTDAAVEFTKVDGLARLERAEVTFTRPDGGHDRFELTTVGWPVYLQGGGYHGGFDDHQGRGVYRGDDHSESDVWDISHPVNVVDPRGLFEPRKDAWAEQFAQCANLDDPDDLGFGHLECVIP